MATQGLPCARQVPGAAQSLHYKHRLRSSSSRNPRPGEVCWFTQSISYTVAEPGSKLGSTRLRNPASSYPLRFFRLLGHV